MLPCSPLIAYKVFALIADLSLDDFRFYLVLHLSSVTALLYAQISSVLLMLVNFDIFANLIFQPHSTTLCVYISQFLCFLKYFPVSFSFFLLLPHHYNLTYGRPRKA